MTQQADKNNTKLKDLLHNIEIKLELLNKEDDDCPFCLEPLAESDHVTLGNLSLIKKKSKFSSFLGIQDCGKSFSQPCGNHRFIFSGEFYKNTVKLPKLPEKNIKCMKATSSI